MTVTIETKTAWYSKYVRQMMNSGCATYKDLLVCCCCCRCLDVIFHHLMVACVAPTLNVPTSNPNVPSNILVDPRLTWKTKYPNLRVFDAHVPENSSFLYMVACGGNVYGDGDLHVRVYDLGATPTPDATVTPVWEIVVRKSTCCRARLTSSSDHLWLLETKMTSANAVVNTLHVFSREEKSFQLKKKSESKCPFPCTSLVYHPQRGTLLATALRIPVPDDTTSFGDEKSAILVEFTLEGEWKKQNIVLADKELFNVLDVHVLEQSSQEVLLLGMTVTKGEPGSLGRSFTLVSRLNLDTAELTLLRKVSRDYHFVERSFLDSRNMLLYMIPITYGDGVSFPWFHYDVQANALTECNWNLHEAKTSNDNDPRRIEAEWSPVGMALSQPAGKRVLVLTGHRNGWWSIKIHVF